MNSEPHQNALIKVLNKTYVAHNISIAKVDQLVKNIVASNFIAFNDDEIQKLYISLKNVEDIPC